MKEEFAAAQADVGKPELLFTGADWDFETLQRTHDAIEVIARKELGLDPYPAQIEVITAEQMLDAYSSVGMPQSYAHWSFGKSFVYNETRYNKGLQGLAYEIVINSNPSICYIMEGNSMTMQALVIAHAAFGHNHFFKNNATFKQWTQADAILDYLRYARDYVASCIEKYGEGRVERVLDAAHALGEVGVDRYGRKTFKLYDEERRQKERMLEYEQNYNDLWRTVPGFNNASPAPLAETPMGKRQQEMKLPQDNILYFLEKFSPVLEDWEREIIRIVRSTKQYYYPQTQTKVANEGCATFVHYEIMTRLHEKGLISDGSYLEFLHSHTSVIFQPDYDHPRYSGINPYALGFAMMSDIKRICLNPTAEDREWFRDWAGNHDPYGTLRYAWANFRDEDFIRQFLSPAVMRKMRLFSVKDDHSEKKMQVEAIHNEKGYRDVRRLLADSYDVSNRVPVIEIVSANISGDRVLMLEHLAHDGIPLDPENAVKTLKAVADMWGYKATLKSLTVPGVKGNDGKYAAEPLPPAPGGVASTHRRALISSL